MKIFISYGDMIEYEHELNTDNSFGKQLFNERMRNATDIDTVLYTFLDNISLYK